MTRFHDGEFEWDCEEPDSQRGFTREQLIHFGHKLYHRTEAEWLENPHDSDLTFDQFNELMCQQYDFTIEDWNSLVLKNTPYWGDLKKEKNYWENLDV
jgi:hypothetical protein